MRKIANLALAIAFVIFLVDWSVMGIKLLDNDYNIITEAYIGLACFIIVIVCVLIRSFTDRCPHCGKIMLIKGAYCSHCGKKIDEKYSE